MNDDEYRKLVEEDVRLSRELSAQLRELNGINKKKAVKGTSNWPYYREGYAREMKAVIDRLVSTRATQVINCAHEQFNTHTIRISQSLSYLLDHLDPDGKYKQLRAHFSIVHDRPNNRSFVRFRSVPIESFDADPLIPDALAFIQEAKPREIFERTGLSLSPQMTSEVEKLLVGLDERFVSSFNGTELIIGRLE